MPTKEEMRDWNRYVQNQVNQLRTQKSPGTPSVQQLVTTRDGYQMPKEEAEEKGIEYLTPDDPSTTADDQATQSASFSQLLDGYAKTRDARFHSASRYSPEYLPSELGVGTSKWDYKGPDAKLSEQQAFDIEDTRGRRQDNASKWVNGTTKLIGKTATQVVGGTVGSVWGLANGMYDLVTEGTFSGVYNHGVANFLDSVDNWLDHKLPHHYTNGEREMKFWEKLGTANFISDQVFNGMSFLAGAVITELGWAAGLSAAAASVPVTWGATTPAALGAAAGLATNTARILGKGKRILKGLDRAADRQKVLKIMAKAKSARRKEQALTRVRQLYTGASYEAGVESRAHYDALKADLIKEAEWENQRDGKGPLTQDQLLEIEEIVRANSNANFGINLALVGGSNMLMLGKLYGPGLSIQKKLARLNPFAAGPVSVAEGTAEAAYKSNRLLKGLGVSQKYQQKLNKAVSRSKAVLGVPFYEGFIEEGGQRISSTTLHDYALDKYSSKGKENTASLIDSFTMALRDTYGSDEGMTEVMIGAILGLTGLPGVRIANGGSLTAVGGRLNEITQNEQTQRNIATFYNNNKDLLGAIKANSEFSTEMYVLNQLMDQALADGNDAQFKDLENDKLFSYVKAKILTGQFDDIAEDAEAIRKMSNQEFLEFFGYDKNDFADDNAITKKKNDVVDSAIRRSKNIKEAYAKVEGLRNDWGNDPLNQDQKDILRDDLAHALATFDNVSERKKALVKHIADLTGGEIVDGETLVYGDQKFDLSSFTERSLKAEYQAIMEALAKDGKIPEGQKRMSNLRKEALRQRADQIKTILNKYSGPIDLANLSGEEIQILQALGPQLDKWMKEDPKGYTEKLNQLVKYFKDLRHLRGRSDSFITKINALTGNDGANKRIQRIQEIEDYAESKARDASVPDFLSKKAKELFIKYGAKAKFRIKDSNGQETYIRFTEAGVPVIDGTDTQIDPVLLEDLAQKDILPDSVEDAKKALAAIKALKKDKAKRQEELNKEILKVEKDLALISKKIADKKSKNLIGELNAVLDDLNKRIKKGQKIKSDLLAEKAGLEEQINYLNLFMRRYYDKKTNTLVPFSDISLDFQKLREEFSEKAGITGQELGKIISTKGFGGDLINRKERYEVVHDGEKKTVEVRIYQGGTQRFTLVSKDGDKFSMNVPQKGTVKEKIDIALGADAVLSETITDVDKLYSKRAIEKYGLVRESDVSTTDISTQSLENKVNEILAPINKWFKSVDESVEMIDTQITGLMDYRDQLQKVLFDKLKARNTKILDNSQANNFQDLYIDTINTLDLYIKNLESNKKNLAPLRTSKKEHSILLKKLPQMKKDIAELLNNEDLQTYEQYKEYITKNPKAFRSLYVNGLDVLDRVEKALQDKRFNRAELNATEQEIEEFRKLKDELVNSKGESNEAKRKQAARALLNVAKAQDAYNEVLTKIAELEKVLEIKAKEPTTVKVKENQTPAPSTDPVSDEELKGLNKGQSKKFIDPQDNDTVKSDISGIGFMRAAGNFRDNLKILKDLGKKRPNGEVDYTDIQPRPNLKPQELLKYKAAKRQINAFHYFSKMAFDEGIDLKDYVLIPVFSNTQKIIGDPAKEESIKDYFKGTFYNSKTKKYQNKGNASNPLNQHVHLLLARADKENNTFNPVRYNNNYIYMPLPNAIDPTLGNVELDIAVEQRFTNLNDLNPSQLRTIIKDYADLRSDIINKKITRLPLSGLTLGKWNTAGRVAAPVKGRALPSDTPLKDANIKVANSTTLSLKDGFSAKVRRGWSYMYFGNQIAPLVSSNLNEPEVDLIVRALRKYETNYNNIIESIEGDITPQMRKKASIDAQYMGMESAGRLGLKSDIIESMIDFGLRTKPTATNNRKPEQRFYFDSENRQYVFGVKDPTTNSPYIITAKQLLENDPKSVENLRAFLLGRFHNVNSGKLKKPNAKYLVPYINDSLEVDSVESYENYQEYLLTSKDNRAPLMTLMPPMSNNITAPSHKHVYPKFTVGPKVKTDNLEIIKEESTTQSSDVPPTTTTKSTQDTKASKGVMSVFGTDEKQAASNKIDEILNEQDQDEDGEVNMILTPPLNLFEVRRDALRYIDASNGNPLLKEEIEKAKKMLPQNEFEIVDGFIKGNSPEIVGQVKHFGKTLVSNIGPGGVVYHETYHQVTNYILGPDIARAMYREVQGYEGSGRTYKGEVKLFSKFTDKEADEYLAEEFRLLILSNGTYKKDKYSVKKGGFLARMFDRIKTIIRSFMGLDPKFEVDPNMSVVSQVFDSIKSGKFSDFKPNLDRNQNMISNMALLPNLLFRSKSGCGSFARSY